MCAPPGAASCNGSDCEPAKRRVAHEDHRQLAYDTTDRRKEHPQPPARRRRLPVDPRPQSAGRPVRNESGLCPYRTSRNGTAFPYPFRGSDVSRKRVAGASPSLAAKTSLHPGNGSHPHRDVPVFLEVTISPKLKPFFMGGTRTAKPTTEKRYADVIFGAAEDSLQKMVTSEATLAVRKLPGGRPPTSTHRTSSGHDAARDYVFGQRTTATGNDNSQSGSARQESSEQDRIRCYRWKRASPLATR
ncbi:hypothetical protein MTO96_014077 [Rhipicephalus appendiculatus]